MLDVSESLCPLSSLSPRFQCDNFFFSENTPLLHPNPKAPNIYTPCSAQRLDRGRWVLLVATRTQKVYRCEFYRTRNTLRAGAASASTASLPV